MIRIAYPIRYNEIVEEISYKYGIEKELIYAIIKCESGFDKNARSHAGAVGLMQLTPDTFNWLKLTTHENDLGVDKLEDVYTNIKYGTLFISLLRTKYFDDKVVLSAYNAGENKVKKWLQDKSLSRDGITLDRIPYKETNNYVRRVQAVKKIYRKLYFC